MKLGVVSDVHGNMPALSAVDNAIGEEVEGYIFLGDLVGLLGFNDEVVEFAMENTVEAIKGNHDISVVEHGRGLVSNQELSDFERDTTLSQLTEEQKDWIESRSSYRENKDIGVVIAHAKPTPEMSTGLEPRNPGLRKSKFTKTASLFDDEEVDFVMTGHTHKQASLDAQKFGHNIVILNPGSVGQPIKDGQAHYAVIDTETNEYETSSVAYETEPVVDKLRELKVPVEWWN